MLIASLWISSRVFLTVVDNSIEDIIEEILKLATDPIDKLLNLHYSGWEDIWSNGVVQLESEDEALPQILPALKYVRDLAGSMNKNPSSKIWSATLTCQ